MKDISEVKGNSGQIEHSQPAWIIEEVSAYEETNSLEQEVQSLREQNEALQKRVAWLEAQLQAIKDYLRGHGSQPSQPAAAPAGQPESAEHGGQATRPAEQGQKEQGGPVAGAAQQGKAQAKSEVPEQGNQAGEAPGRAQKGQGQSEAAGAAKPVDEEKAEQWIRENLEQWLDSPCPFQKAGGRTWRQLAQNEGAKVPIKGKECPPRAYLHTIERWAACSVWTRLKAKVALEIGKLAACA